MRSARALLRGRRIEESEAAARLLPHREKYLLLVTAFRRRLLDLHLKWIDEVERELGGSPVPGAEPAADVGARGARPG